MSINNEKKKKHKRFLNDRQKCVTRKKKCKSLMYTKVAQNIQSSLITALKGYQPVV